jgi:hypothetical protein
VRPKVQTAMGTIPFQNIEDAIKRRREIVITITNF